MLTIGELASRCRVSTSLLRYYEKEKLLLPSGRTDSGYRLYSEDAERTLRFIRNAQRYGFSLQEIRLIVGSGGGGQKSDADIMALAQQRFLEIERRVTEMLVMRHEMELFLDDLSDLVESSGGRKATRHYRDLVVQVCGHDKHGHRPSSLRKLVKRLNCNLAAGEWEEVFSDLRGEHFHIWRDDDEYSARFACGETKVKRALERIAAGESDCEAHSQPEVVEREGGFVFRARGKNAFLYAQLFLALESEAVPVE